MTLKFFKFNLLILHERRVENKEVQLLGLKILATERGIVISLVQFHLLLSVGQPTFQQQMCLFIIKL